LLTVAACIIAVPMSKSARRSPPRRRSDSPAPRDTQEARGLLDRLMDMPHLAHVVPRLQPEILQQVIQNCGLEACGELMTLATPGQLARVFDLDLWRAGQSGVDEQFDADRFGVWLEVLMESGAGIAAQTVAKMDAGLVIAALAQHARVFDAAAVAAGESTDGEEVAARRSLHDGLGCEVGGFLVLATRTDSWDAIAAVLGVLEQQHHDYFGRVMRGCRRLSNEGHELDGLDDLLSDREQVLFDLAFDREQRREKSGYVSPAQARAFLQMARTFHRGPEETTSGNPIATAYFRGLEWTPTDADERGSANRLPAAPLAPPDSAQAVAAVVDLLLEAGVLPQQPRALLGGSQDPAPRLARIQALMQFARDRDENAFSMRSQEVAYLANTIVAGCSIQARPFTPQEASDAAVAVCNLGLENWQAHPLPDDFLVGHDLISVFQSGWTVLYDQVCMYAAEQLIGVLAALKCDDVETRAGLKALRMSMTKQWRAGRPWQAREALDVITILDMPAWATLLGLIDECPVIHAGLGASRQAGTRAVNASAFEFISENSQIALVRDFMQSLPETLRC
jgi:hypothetical protein